MAEATVTYEVAKRRRGRKKDGFFVEDLFKKDPINFFGLVPKMNDRETKWLEKNGDLDVFSAYDTGTNEILGIFVYHPDWPDWIRFFAGVPSRLDVKKALDEYRDHTRIGDGYLEIMISNEWQKTFTTNLGFSNRTPTRGFNRFMVSRPYGPNVVIEQSAPTYAELTNIKGAKTFDDPRIWDGNVHIIEIERSKMQHEDLERMAHALFWACAETGEPINLNAMVESLTNDKQFEQERMLVATWQPTDRAFREITVGVALVGAQPGTEDQINLFCVMPELRKRFQRLDGTTIRPATEFMMTLLEYMRDSGLKQVRLDAVFNAVEFYQSVGFVAIRDPQPTRDDVEEVRAFLKDATHRPPAKDEADYKKYSEALKKRFETLVEKWNPGTELLLLPMYQNLVDEPIDPPVLPAVVSDEVQRFKGEQSKRWLGLDDLLHQHHGSNNDNQIERPLLFLEDTRFILVDTKPEPTGLVAEPSRMNYEDPALILTWWYLT